MFSRGQILGFGTAVDINVTFEDAANRKRVLVPFWHGSPQAAQEKGLQTLYVFNDKEPMSGEIIITTAPDEVVEYNMLKVEFMGQMNTATSDLRQTIEFNQQILEIEKAAPNTTNQIDCVKVVNYAFPALSKPAESYNGLTTQIRYFLRVTIHRAYAPEIIEEHDIWVQNPSLPPPVSKGIKMEVGLEKCLHIEFEYDKKSYHLQDQVKGKIFFLTVRIRIKYMELSLLKRETLGMKFIFAKCLFFYKTYYT